jgi:hypothetical protein
MVKLRKTQAYMVKGILKYLITYDHVSGKKDRYTVVIPTSDDPVVIGRELDLKTVRSLIQELEDWLGTSYWFGDRRTALGIVKAFYDDRCRNG